MDSKFSNEIVRFIKNHEGLRLTSYVCPGGKLTIGYGHTGPEVRGGLTITRAEAEELLHQDMKSRALEIQRMVRVPLKQHQMEALLSLVFNIGVGAFKGSSLLRLLNLGQYQTVPHQIKRWDRATVNGKLTRLPGLTKRRAAEVDFWNGEYV